MDLFDFLGIGVVVMVGLVLLFGCVGHFATPEIGIHVAKITETGYGGLFWKTHYAKAVSTQFSMDSDASWSYGFDEDEKGYELYKRALELQRSNVVAKIEYECKLYVSFWHASDACIVTNLSIA